MALKFVVDEKEFSGLKPEMQSLYKAGQDGKYRLDAEADPDDKKKVEEFRSNNINLKKQIEELEKRFNGIDPDEVKKLKKRAQDLDDQKLIDAGKLDEVVNQRTERMRAELTSQIDALKAALDERDGALSKTTSRLSEVLIDAEVTKAVTAVGQVKQGAMQDILNRAKGTWILEDGKPVPKDGDKLIFGKDGKNLMTFDEWAATLYKSASYFFEPTKGSGGAGSVNQNRGKVDAEAFSKLPPTERLKQIHAQKSAGK